MRFFPLASPVNVTVQHVFSVEKDEAKRAFLMAAHVYSDVKCFVDGHAREREHPVKHTLDMLISGPSCKNVSNENANRKDFVECYSDGSGSSGETYQYGFKEAIKQTTPTVSLFENTLACFVEHILRNHNIYWVP